MYDANDNPMLSFLSVQVRLLYYCDYSVWVRNFVGVMFCMMGGGSWDTMPALLHATFCFLLLPLYMTFLPALATSCLSHVPLPTLPCACILCCHMCLPAYAMPSCALPCLLPACLPCRTPPFYYRLPAGAATFLLFCCWLWFIGFIFAVVCMFAGMMDRSRATVSCGTPRTWQTLLVVPPASG